jgi:hypothetical protein
MKKKLKPTPKPSTDLVWVDVALTSSPSDALAYGFMSPDLVPIINRLIGGSRHSRYGGYHSIVMGGICFEEVSETQRKAFLRMNTTKWEEVAHKNKKGN